MIRYSKVLWVLLMLSAFGCSDRRSGSGGTLGLPGGNNNNNNNTDSVTGDSDGVSGNSDGLALADTGAESDVGASGGDDAEGGDVGSTSGEDAGDIPDTESPVDWSQPTPDVVDDEDVWTPEDMSTFDVGNEEDLSSCIPDCFDKVCGDDGCGNSCGDCAGGGLCKAGQCMFDTEACEIILSDCVANLPISPEQACQSFIAQDQECFSAMSSAYATMGCDDMCGNSFFATAAVEAICSSACQSLKSNLVATSLFSETLCGNCGGCVPSCSGKQCGSDGCGGQCGTCPASATCESGKCVTKSNDCADAIDVCAPGLPVDPSLACGVIASEPTCESAIISAYKSGSCVQKCSAANGAGQGAVQALCGAGCTGTKSQMVSLGLFDNGWCAECILEQCVPKCSGKACGSDGCGGQCGTCGAGKTCNASGQCVSTTTLVCEDINVPAGVCNDANPANCTCIGCFKDGSCTLEDDCVCSDCKADSFCGSAANCVNDGKCSPYNEGCICADCKSHPECLK